MKLLEKLKLLFRTSNSKDGPTWRDVGQRAAELQQASMVLATQLEMLKPQITKKAASTGDTHQQEAVREKLAALNDVQRNLAHQLSTLADYILTLKNWNVDLPPSPAKKTYEKPAPDLKLATADTEFLEKLEKAKKEMSK